ncbi:MAG: GTP-binding protein, partial [Clostridia bacterium]|nr:GTP-binding protein [Clostridia bacterium]
VIDASKCKMYMKNFAEFYRNQIEYATAIVLSRTDGIREDKLKECIQIIRGVNENASIVTTPWDQVDGKSILAAAESKDTLESRLHELMHEHHHHHDHECDDPEWECHHHEHEHHHDHECDDPECECHHHEHEHHHDHDCDCHEHGHHHHDHGHHHADDVFTSWGVETADKFTLSDIEDCLDELMTGKFGTVLRAKGIVASSDGQWIHFDYVPGEKSVRYGASDITGKLCVIGTGLDKHGLHHLFERG